MTDVAYILAASHSGSTLLAMLLGAHPDARTVGELKITSLGDVERYRCSCGELIRACPFWRRVSEGMARRGIPFDIAAAGTDVRTGVGPYAARLLRPLHRGPLLEMVRDTALTLTPGWKSRLADVQRRNAALVATISELSGARVIVDSSKVGLRLKYLLQNPDIRVRVIRLVRDGRAVASTYMYPAELADASNPKLRGGGMGGDRAAERLTAVEAANEWRRSNEEAEAALRRVDRDRWIQVHYEDVCRDTAGTLARLFSFLGLDPDRRARDFRSVEHHVIGNGMRLDQTSEIQLDERWRTVLTPSDLQEFDSVAGEMNRRCGYQ